MNVKLLVCAFEMRTDSLPLLHPTSYPTQSLHTKVRSGLKGFAFSPVVWMCGVHTFYLAAISEAQLK